MQSGVEMHEGQMHLQSKKKQFNPKQSCLQISVTCANATKVESKMTTQSVPLVQKRIAAGIQKPAPQPSRGLVVFAKEVKK